MILIEIEIASKIKIPFLDHLWSESDKKTRKLFDFQWVLINKQVIYGFLVKKPGPRF